MSGPVYLTQPNIIRLPGLLMELRNGEIRIPRFQRPFVWTDDQRLLLLQSIYEGMPIGGILVWRTREHDLNSYSRIGHLPLGTVSTGGNSDEVKQYLLDGHQRLTTLYTALGEGLIPSDDEDSSIQVEPVTTDEDASLTRNWSIYFDLEERDFQLHTKRSEEPPNHWLPLTILFDPYRLHEFQGKLVQAGSKRSWINRAEALASTFKDYSIPMVPIVTEDLELVTESFQRINSAGTDMDQVHMVSALTWSQDFDLNQRMQEIREELGQVGWQDLEEKIILNTCKAALGLDVYRSEVKAIQAELQDDPEVLDRVTLYLLEAAKFLLQHCHVHGPATLPYSFQIILLSEALRHGTDDLNRELPSELREKLQRWFWITTYTEYFASINSTRLRLELEHLQNVVTQGDKDPMPPGLTSHKVQAVRRFDFRAARSRALALRLAEQSSEPETAYKLLAQHGKDAAPMLVPSRKIRKRELAGEPANRIIIDPRDLSEFRRKTQDDSQDVKAQRLRSHIISEKAHQALTDGDWVRFITMRRAEIDDIERVFVEDLGLEYVLE